MKKFKRQISIVAAMLMIFGGTFMFRHFANQKKAPPRKPPVKELIRQVSTLKVENVDLSSDLDVQGRLIAFNKIDIFGEVSGSLIETAKPFKVGSYFKKGDVLLKIDDTEAKLALLSQKASLMNAITQMMPDLKIDYQESFSHWKQYLDKFDVKQELQAFPQALNEQEKYFISNRNLHSQYYNIKSQEERLSKYSVYAPFSGVITEAMINPGSLVRAGQKMGELMNTSNYELEASVRMADLKYVKPGNTVQLYSPDLEGQWAGKVKRISDQIDPNTQTVIAYISVRGQNLREGMYLRGKIRSRIIKNVVELPRELIVNQNSVFRIENDTMIKLQPIELITLGEETAVVKGLEDGMQILGSMFPGAYNGQRVRVTQKEPGAAGTSASLN